MSRGAPRPRHVLWPSGDRPDSPRASARPSRTRSERAEEFLLHGAVSRDRRAGVVGTAVERGPVASAPCGRSIEHVICLPVSTPVTPTRPLGRREGGQARRVRDERPTRDRSVPSGPAPVTSARQRTLECAGRPGSGELGDAPAALRARLRRRGHESGAEQGGGGLRQTARPLLNVRSRNRAIWFPGRAAPRPIDHFVRTGRSPRAVGCPIGDGEEVHA